MRHSQKECRIKSKERGWNMKNADKKKRKHGGRERRYLQLYYHAMMLPGMLFVLIFAYAPMVGIVMAFQNYMPARGILGSEWVGLKHFIRLFSMSDCWEIFRNTLVIASGKLVLSTLVSIIFAILLNEIRHTYLKKCIQTVVYLPHFMSWVVLAAIVTNMFSLDGVINHIGSFLNMKPINFLGSNKTFQPLLIWTDVWKEFGYGAIIYLAAITSVDPGLHEAAAIDGASWWKRVWHVTLPAMLPIILMMAAINISGILNAGFDQVYNLYSPLVYETGDILDTYVYRAGLISRKYSFGTAVGLLKSVVGMILMLGANLFSEKCAHRKIF